MYNFTNITTGSSDENSSQITEAVILVLFYLFIFAMCFFDPRPSQTQIEEI